MQLAVLLTSTPLAYLTGLPMSSVSVRASRSPWAWMSSANLMRMRLRTAGALPAQRRSSNAARAAATAASMSAWPQRATWVSRRPSTGEMQSKVWPSRAATRAPLIRARPSKVGVWVSVMVGSKDTMAPCYAHSGACGASTLPAGQVSTRRAKGAFAQVPQKVRYPAIWAGGGGSA
jgi:hypothetical protein